MACVCVFDLSQHGTWYHTARKDECRRTPSASRRGTEELKIRAWSWPDRKPPSASSTRRARRRDRGRDWILPSVAVSGEPILFLGSSSRESMTRFEATRSGPSRDIRSGFKYYFDLQPDLRPFQLSAAAWREYLGEHWIFQLFTFFLVFHMSRDNKQRFRTNR